MKMDRLARLALLLVTYVFTAGTFTPTKWKQTTPLHKIRSVVTSTMSYTLASCDGSSV